MQTLQIDSKTAKKLFPTASEDLKQMLTDTFGENFFAQKITDRVKSYEDACEVLGMNPATVIVDNTLVKDTASIVAYAKLIIIARALNEGWTPDWTNGNQYKWFPYFKYDAGFGFSFTDCDFWYSDTNVGSRLCFKSEELAEYAAKQFQPIYNDFLTLQ